MNMTKHIGVLLALFIAAAALPVSAHADRGDGHRGWHDDGHRGWDGERHRDFHGWRDGHWDHRYHDGRLGWWWISAGSWYFYPQPVYPYPYPVLSAPPVVVAPSAVPSVPPPTEYWYYCDAAKAYYPYVASCPGGWRAVPAIPAGAPAR